MFDSGFRRSKPKARCKYPRLLPSSQLPSPRSMAKARCTWSALADTSGGRRSGSTSRQLGRRRRGSPWPPIGSTSSPTPRRRRKHRSRSPGRSKSSGMSMAQPTLSASGHESSRRLSSTSGRVALALEERGTRMCKPARLTSDQERTPKVAGPTTEGTSEYLICTA